MACVDKSTPGSAFNSECLLRSSSSPQLPPFLLLPLRVRGHSCSPSSFSFLVVYVLHHDHNALVNLLSIPL